MILRLERFCWRNQVYIKCVFYYQYLHDMDQVIKCVFYYQYLHDMDQVIKCVFYYQYLHDMDQVTCIKCVFYYQYLHDMDQVIKCVFYYQYLHDMDQVIKCVFYYQYLHDMDQVKVAWADRRTYKQICFSVCFMWKHRRQQAFNHTVFVGITLKFTFTNISAKWM